MFGFLLEPAGMALRHLWRPAKNGRQSQTCGDICFSSPSRNTTATLKTATPAHIAVCIASEVRIASLAGNRTCTSVR